MRPWPSMFWWEITKLSSSRTRGWMPNWLFSMDALRHGRASMANSVPYRIWHFLHPWRSDGLAASLRNICTYAGCRPLEPLMADFKRCLNKLTLLNRLREIATKRLENDLCIITLQPWLISYLSNPDNFLIGLSLVIYKMKQRVIKQKEH